MSSCLLEEMAKGKKNGKKVTTNVVQPPKQPFDWCNFLLDDNKFKAAPVSLFPNLNITSNWPNLINTSLKVEVFNPTAVLPSDIRVIHDCFWIAGVIQIEGFFVCLRWEGYDDDDEDDFWVNIYDQNLHSVGYAQKNKKHLLPPKSIAKRHPDWRNYLRTRLLGTHTLPDNFREQLDASLKSKFKIGLKLEAIDINRVSSMRCATVIDVKGTRCQIAYDPSLKVFDYTNSLWCDERSNLIQPVGWSRLVGHELKSTKAYAESSSNKVKTGVYDEDDADFSYFPSLFERMKEPYIPNETVKFEEGMRIEAIDALNMKTVNVATVFKVLRFDYLMIGVDGMTSEDGSDAFCYHRSDCLPINYAKKYKIALTKPEDYTKKKFDYTTYLNDIGAKPAPLCLFKDDTPDREHSFKKGMYIEAADLMEPHLVCPAFIKQVAGKLLKISFCGWSDDYDQWLDCKSPEIYPVGYCYITGYMLEHPKNSLRRESKSMSESDESEFNEPVRKISNISKSKTPTKAKSPSIPRPTGKRKRDDVKVSSSGKSAKKVKELNQRNSNVYDFNTESSNDTVVLPFNNYLQSKTTPAKPTKSSPKPADKPDLSSPNVSLPTKPSPKPADKPDLSSPNVSLPTKSSPIPVDKSNLTSPVKWSVEEVKNFWIENGFPEYSQLFADKQIRGDKLMQLTRDDVYKIIGDKLGPSLKMFTMIDNLKKLHQIE